MCRSSYGTLALLVYFACASSAYAAVVAYAAGDVAECKGPAQASVAARTAAMIPADAVVFIAGDTVYPLADRATLESCYTPTWGRLLPRTYAVPGNHDYVGGSPRDFLNYFGARTPGRTWFRAAVGDWWVIGLDSNVGGPRLEEQQRWLEGQLREVEGDGRCMLALWHHPLFSTGLHRKDGARMLPAWKALSRAGADLVLNGHEHFYESFEPKDAEGHADKRGMREIIAGTGGAHLHDLSIAGGYRAYARAFGLLRLELDADRYTYTFRTLDGRVLDSGGATCRRTH